MLFNLLLPPQVLGVPVMAPDIRVVRAWGGASISFVMTTPGDKKEKPENYFEWDVPPLSKDDVKEIEFKDTLRHMLRIYQPVEDERDSDYQFTTQELVKAIEIHFGIPQGEETTPRFDAQDLVDYMYELGYTCVNTGGLQMQWLMKKK